MDWDGRRVNRPSGTARPSATLKDKLSAGPADLTSGCIVKSVTFFVCRTGTSLTSSVFFISFIKAVWISQQALKYAFTVRMPNKCGLAVDFLPLVSHE